MPFLKLNGWTIPIERGGSAEALPIGSSERAFDGTPLVDLWKLKRKWSFTTAILSAQERDALIGLLHGTGDQWSFDLSPGGYSPLYSDKGSPEAGTAVAAYRARLAPNKSVIYDHAISGTIPTDALFGSQSMTNTPGSSVTNLYIEKIRKCEPDTTGFTATGLTLAYETAQRMAGAGCLKATTTATGQFFTTATDPSVVSGWHVLSFYYKGDGPSITIDVTGSTQGLIASQSPTVIAGEWTRVYVTFQSTASQTIDVKITPTHPSGTLDWYFDSFQLETGSIQAGSVANDYIPTTWVDGTRAAGVAPQYDDLTYIGETGLTLALWVKTYPAFWTGNTEQYIGLYSTDNNPQLSVTIYRDASMALKADIVYGSDTYSISYTSMTYIFGWMHFALTLTPAGTTSTAILYASGADVGSVAVPRRMDFLRDAYLKVGGNGSSLLHRGAIDSVRLLPYAAPPTMIAGLATDLSHYRYDQSGAPTPRLIASGAYHEAPTEVVGAVTGIAYEPVHAPGGFDAARCRVAFDLESVGAV